MTLSNRCQALHFRANFNNFVAWLRMIASYERKGHIAPKYGHILALPLLALCKPQCEKTRNKFINWQTSLSHWTGCLLCCYLSKFAPIYESRALTIPRKVDDHTGHTTNHTWHIKHISKNSSKVTYLLSRLWDALLLEFCQEISPLAVLVTPSKCERVLQAHVGTSAAMWSCWICNANNSESLQHC